MSHSKFTGSLPGHNNLLCRKTKFWVVLSVWVFALLSLYMGTSTTAIAKDQILVQAGISYYLDTRQYNTLSFQTNVSKLPFDTKLSGFTDLHGLQDSGSKREDMRRSFSEYRLTYDQIFRQKWRLSGLGVQAEWNDGTPGDDDVGRFGVVYTMWMKPVKKEVRPGFIVWRALPLETDGDGGQLSMLYRVPLSDVLTWRGFVDYNYMDDDDVLVAESEIKYSFGEQFAGLVELRYNQAEDEGDQDATGLAFGIQLNY